MNLRSASHCTCSLPVSPPSLALVGRCARGVAGVFLSVTPVLSPITGEAVCQLALIGRYMRQAPPTPGRVTSRYPSTTRYLRRALRGSHRCVLRTESSVHSSD